MLGWALYTIANPTQLGQQAVDSVDAWILRWLQMSDLDRFA